MELNFTPINTSNNYGINSINIDLLQEKNAILQKKHENYSNFSQKYDNFSYDIDNNVELNYSAELSNSNTLNDEIKHETINNSNHVCTANIINSTEKTIHFYFNFDKDNNYLVNIFNININNNVESKIIIEFLSQNACPNYSNINININAKENSNTDIIVFSDLGEHSTNLVSIQSNVEKNAIFNINFVNIASKYSIYNYYSKINGENAISNLKSLYIGDDVSTIDLNYLIELFAPKSKTDMDIIGSLSKNAKKHFKGTIDFKKGCPKSVGAENELCMLLSNTAKSKALPMILCTEEDVDGKHSSSIGKVDDKELFYIMTRGLTKTEATKLIIKARFNKIITSLFDETIKSKIINTIDRKIK